MTGLDCILTEEEPSATRENLRRMGLVGRSSPSLSSSVLLRVSEA